MIYLFMLLAVFIQFLVAYAQYNMKVGSRKLDFVRGFSYNMKNRHLLLAVILFLVITVLSVFTLKFMDFSIYYSFTALNYLFIMFFSWKILKEKFDRLRITGNILVIIGIIIFNLR